MAFAGTDSNHWWLQKTNEIDTTHNSTNHDRKWEYEGNNGLEETDIFGKSDYENTYEAANFNEWDSSDELYDQGDEDWLVNSLDKGLIKKEDEC